MACYDESAGVIVLNNKQEACRYLVAQPGWLLLHTRLTLNALLLLALPSLCRQWPPRQQQRCRPCCAASPS
jgi:hypothetical protein